MKVGVSLRSGYAPDGRAHRRTVDGRAGARRGRRPGSTACSSATTTTCPCPTTRTSRCSAACSRSGTTRPAARCSCCRCGIRCCSPSRSARSPSIAAGPFIMQCAVGGGAEQFDALGVPLRDRGRRGSKPRSTSSAACARAKTVSTDAPCEDRPGPHRAGPARAARGVDRRARRRRRSTARPGSATRSSSAPKRRPAEVAALVRDATASACARHGRTPATDRRAPRRARRRRRRRRRARSRARSSTRGYRGFDPAAPVVGGVRRGRRRVRRPRRGGLHRRDRPPPRRRPGRGAGVVRAARRGACDGDSSHRAPA